MDCYRRPTVCEVCSVHAGYYMNDEPMERQVSVGVHAQLPNNSNNKLCHNSQCFKYII